MLARNYLSGPETVEVHIFKKMTPTLGSMRYVKDIDGKPVFVEDVFAVPKDGVMDILDHTDLGKLIVATIVPDQSGNPDAHPEINSAVIQGVREETTA